MLRAGRINTDDVNTLLNSLPDLEESCETVQLNQPALDLAAAASRQASTSVESHEDESDGADDDAEAEA